MKSIDIENTTHLMSSHISLRGAIIGMCVIAFGILGFIRFEVYYSSPLHSKSVAFSVQVSTGYRVKAAPFFFYFAESNPLQNLASGGSKRNITNSNDESINHKAGISDEVTNILDTERSSAFVPFIRTTDIDLMRNFTAGSGKDTLSVVIGTGPLIDRIFLILNREEAEVALGAPFVQSVHRAVDVSTNGRVMVKYCLDVTSLSLKNKFPKNTISNWFFSSLFFTSDDKFVLKNLQSAISNATRNRHRNSSYSSDDGVTLFNRHAIVIDPDQIIITRRYPAKTHLTSMFETLLNYPLAYIMISNLRMIEISSITPNLITCLHPCVAVLAALCFYYSVKKVPKNYNKLPTDNAVPQIFSEMHSDANDTSTCAFPNTSITCLTVVPPSGPVSSFPVTLAENSTIGPSVQPQWDNGAHPDSLSCNSNNSNIKIEPNMIIAGCFLFWTRNWLDSVDGVLARYKRIQNSIIDLPPPTLIISNVNGISTPPTTPVKFGFNGHSLDVICDIFGGCICSIGLLSIIWRQEVLISQFWFTCLHRIPLLKDKLIGLRRLKISRAVAILGLCTPLAVSGCWEVFMLRYHNLLDSGANSNMALYQLENNIFIRLNWFVWSVICGDSILVYYIIAMALDNKNGGKHLFWPLLQVLAFLGYALTLITVLISLAVWLQIVMKHPEASSTWNHFIATESQR
eukprot:Tbor_TRINITY_DN5364_c0_g1::TRINITY_DN5364_c0_g1_i1::g.4603::m.4603